MADQPCVMPSGHWFHNNRCDVCGAVEHDDCRTGGPHAWSAPLAGSMRGQRQCHYCGLTAYPGETIELRNGTGRVVRRDYVDAPEPWVRNCT